MKRIDLVEQHLDLQQLLDLAQQSPIVIVADDGKEYIIALADDFDQEIAQLRESTLFQSFLDSRTASKRPRRPLEAVSQALEAELPPTSHEQ